MRIVRSFQPMLGISVLLCAASAFAQAPSGPARLLHATAGHDASKSTAGDAYADTTEVIAALQMRLTEARPAQKGAVWFEFSADTGPGSQADHVTIRIPLASTDAPSADTRTCTIQEHGTHRLTLTAAPEAKNAIPFQKAGSSTNIELVLNQYLCRALQGPYVCNGVPITLSGSWTKWHLARTARLLLTSEAPATLELSPVAIIATDRRFTPAQCPIPIMSNPRP